MSNEGFLSRWSRRKVETREEIVTPVQPVVVEVAEEAPVAVPAEIPPEVTQEEQDTIVADLPDVESLTEESDFTAFLQEGVPRELQKLALRKLWRSNPIFANLDGLNDYDEDFTKIIPLAEGVAEELQKLMKENSRTQPEPEETVVEADEEEGATDADVEPVPEGDVVAESPEAEDDDHDVGDGEDDF